MENAVQIKNGVLAVLAVAGSVLANALGGWDGALKVLVAFMICDYICGILVAAVKKESNKSSTGALDSRAGFKGIIKKCLILMVVFLASMMDKGMGIHYIRNAVVLFYVGNEGLSLIENTALLGFPWPDGMKNALDAMRKKGDEGTGTHNG
jgi:toxin secretion/phage lysis holin